MPYDVGLPNYRGSGNVIYDSGDYPAVLRRALEMADYERLTRECPERSPERPAARRRRRACYVELTGVGPFEGATIRADAAGRITVFTGVPSQGQGLETTLAQIAADELGVTPDRRHYRRRRHARHRAGRRHLRQSRRRRRRHRRRAGRARRCAPRLGGSRAQALGVAEDEMEQDGKSFTRRASPEHRIELGRVAAVAAMATAAHGVTPGLEATHFFQPPDIAYSAGAHVVLVEVDAETARVRLLAATG